MLAKKSLLYMLILCMILCILPNHIAAATSGSCGTNVTWSLDASGTLTISGSGSMKDYSFETGTGSVSALWRGSSSSQIKKIIVESNVTSIGTYAFATLPNLKSVELPETLKTIGLHAFHGCTALETITIPSSVTSIENYAFSVCDAMQTMVFLGNAPSLGDEEPLPTHTGFQVVYDDTKSGWDNAVWSKYTKVNATQVDGYTVTVSPSTDTPMVDEYIYMLIQPNDTFASAELQLQFDPAYFSYVADTTGLATGTYETHGATITVENGVLKLADYGAEKSTYKLPFQAKKDGTTTFKLLSAKFSKAEKAALENLTVAAIPNDVAEIQIQHPGFSVQFVGNWFTGNEHVAYGEDYVFTVAEDNIYYNYEFAATMGGETVEVAQSGDTFTIQNVTGDLVIQATRTPKKFAITFHWEDGTEPDVTNAIFYGTDYTFTIPEIEHYNVQMQWIRYTNDPSTSVLCSITDQTVTVLGTSITDDIIVNFTKTKSDATVTVVGAVGDITYNGHAEPGVAYTFQVNKDAKYNYDVKAKVNGNSVELTESAGTYTIRAEDVQAGTIEITITKTLKVDGVTVSQYLQLNSTKIWRICISSEHMESRTYVYNDVFMFWSEKYGGYCTLVIADQKPVVTTVELSLQSGKAKAVDYAMDVNKSGVLDANDAQLAYNMYNCYYNSFDENVNIEKFLRADVNGDGTVNTNDAALIVDAIL